MPMSVDQRHQAVKRVAPKRPALLSFYAGKRIKRLQTRHVLRRQMTVTLRKFRTQPDRRSAKLRQRVYPFRLLGYRELAIALRVKPKRQARNSRLLSARRLIISPAALMVLGITGTLFFSLNLQHPVVLAPKHAFADQAVSDKPVEPVAKTLPRSQPTHLSIPKIQLDADIVPTGLDSAGVVKVPDNPWTAGWLENSPTPGELGPAVIVGHVDWIDNIAVFWRLRDLAPGDSVSISRADGTTASFTVTQIAQYSQDQFPTDAVYGNINYAGLRLITCGGTFNTATHHYDQNTVVFGELAS